MLDRVRPMRLSQVSNKKRPPVAGKALAAQRQTGSDYGAGTGTEQFYKHFTEQTAGSIVY